MSEKESNQTSIIDKPVRPEPKLQEMRIVQVSGPMPEPFNPTMDPSIQTQQTPGGPPARTPLNPTGKKLNMSKKEIEALARNKKPKGPTPFIYKPQAEVIADNSIRIDDLDRNTKSGQADSYEPNYDLEWVNTFEGRHVSIAWLQTPVSISGFISSESTLSSANLKLRGLTMCWLYNGSGLECKIDNTNGVKYLFIPAANIKCMSYE